MVRRKKITELEIETTRLEDEYIASLNLEDDYVQEEQETSFDRETYDYDLEPEDDYSNEKGIKPARQINKCISFDSIKLKLPLIEAEYVEFSVNRQAFFRTGKPQIPANKEETRGNLITLSDNPVSTMQLTNEEDNYADKSMMYEYARKKYPNAKPFFDFTRRLGVGHMYFKDGYFICQINGKITSENNYLGLINKDNIIKALENFKGFPKYDLVRFNNEKFIEKAQVLLVHVTNDIEVADINSTKKALSSFLPIRTDKFNVLKYGNTGYEILPRGKQSTCVPKHSLCMYTKGEEIRCQNRTTYKNNIGEDGLALAEKVLRLELRLYNFKAIRTYLAPDIEDGTITIQQLLNCNQTPIINDLAQIGITKDNLKKARGEYISMKEDTLLTVAQLERMHGLIHLLKQNDYSLDKVRSYIEAETGKKMRSDELKNAREILQRYIACYKPRTIKLLTELLECMTY